MAAILKVPVLILGAWLIEVGIKPPTPAAKKEKGDKVSSTSQRDFEKYVRMWSMVARVSLVTSAIVLSFNSNTNVVWW